MIQRVFGHTGAQVPVIGQGTWNMERDGKKKSIAALQAGLDLGLSHIDTAEMYGDGRVEEIVGEALEGRRAEAFLVSKVLPHHASHRGVISACESSLERLGVDTIDVYLLHWPGEVPLEETVKAFDELQEAGKIQAWGVSNFDVDEMRELVGIAGKDRIACNQVLYHLEQRYIERELLPFCQEQGIAVVGYSPFGSGRFPSARRAGGKVLADIAERLDATPRQVALAFLCRLEGTFVIPKAGQVAHVQDNAGAADLVLDDADIEALDAAFPVGHHSSLPFV